MVETKEWYTVNEAAEYLGISRRTVYKLCENSRLPVSVIGAGRSRRFKRDDLDNVPTRLGKGESTTDIFKEMTAESDPVLAALWDNDLDAIYDRI